eukprot:TRINITY_DN36669_c0_g1_i1.p1 TRINITY_DN36669_c0_g1~~TRINITY_DN36669_c0_g1_i1.p1  ORF type:complete len:734 (+),score=155.45 TRINITY_DN36669_c0_g1_i1:110-2203(+)
MAVMATIEDEQMEPTIPSSWDEAPLKGPMSTSQFAWTAHAAASSTAPSGDEDAGSARVLHVLAEVQQQLQQLLHGQAALLGSGLAQKFQSCGHMTPPATSAAAAAGFQMQDVSLGDIHIVTKPPRVPSPWGAATPPNRDGGAVLHDISGTLSEQSAFAPIRVPSGGSGDREPMTPTSPRGKRRARLMTGKVSKASSSKGANADSKGSPRDRALTDESTSNLSAVPSVATKSVDGGAEKAQAYLRSRSAFDCGRTADEDKNELKEVFLHAERVIREIEERPPLKDRILNMTRAQKEMGVDSIIGVIIVLNAIFIGFSMDSAPESQQTILAIDICFSVSFVSELLAKLYVNGYRVQYLGSQRWMNLFDATLIVIDLVQLSILLVNPNAANSVGDMPSASLFRVVRLVRLVRILRLLRHPVLQTLLMMMHGMIGGLPTLGWALLLFVISVYMVALMCREFLGRNMYPNIYEYFSDVPRAMITTFRCSFGDCSTLAGTPIFEHVDERYGIWFSAFYCLFNFTMAIGMFNVISAIFVQSTMAAATGMKTKQKKQRLQDDDLWSTRVSTIVRQIATLILGIEEADRLSDNVDVIYDLDVSCDTMDKLGSDPVIQHALEELDVDPEDHEALSEILDVDGNGSVVVIELLQGIKRLRGNPRRSDIVTLDLLCRSMQSTMQEVHQLLVNMRPLGPPPGVWGAEGRV